MVSTSNVEFKPRGEMDSRGSLRAKIQTFETSGIHHLKLKRFPAYPSWIMFVFRRFKTYGTINWRRSRRVFGLKLNVKADMYEQVTLFSFDHSRLTTRGWWLESDMLYTV